MRCGLWMLVAGLLVTAAACAHGGGATGEVQPASAPVRLEVTNNNNLAMQIYVVGSGVSRRLGTVEPGMVGRFAIPQGMLGNGPIEVEARGAQVIRSGQLLLAAGQVIDFRIGTSQIASTATVR